MRRAKLGDVYYVKLINGYKIFQWAYKIPKKGNYIRVFDGLYEAVPENIEEIVAGDHSYITDLYATRAYRIGLIYFLGNYPVPEKYPFPQYSIRFDERNGRIYRIRVRNENNVFEDCWYDVGSIKELPEKFQNVKLLSSCLHPAWLFYLFDIGFDLSAPVGFYPGLAGKAAMDKLKIYEDMVNTAVEEERRKKAEKKRMPRTGPM